MWNRRRWQSAPVLLALLAVAAMAAPAGAAAPAAAKGWPMKQDNAGYYVVETPHYVIKTDLGPDAAQLFARHQEALFFELYKRMAGNKAGIVQIPRGTVVVVSTEEKYLALLGSDAKGSQGQYDPNTNQISAWGSGDEADQALETLRHEGTHQFVHQFIGSKCPLWLNEGLADFFERAQFVGGQLQVGQTPPYHLAELKRALEEKRLFSIPDMLTRTHEAWLEAVKSGSKEASLQYAEAWAMVHFLQGADNAKYQGPFVQYIWHLGRGRSSKEAWDAAFGDSVAAFEKRFRDYIKDLQPSVSRTCRSNLQLLGFILIDLGAEKAPADMASFRQSLLDGKPGGWTFKNGSGDTLSTADPELAKSLFRCPEDTTGKPDVPSYELIPAKAGEPPGVRCRCHAGLFQELTYEKDSDGKLKAKVVSKPATSAPPPKTGLAAKSPASTGAQKP